MDKFTVEKREVTDSSGRWRVTWCGPYALATVAKRSYEEAYQYIKSIVKKRHVKGVTYTILEKALNDFGIIGHWTVLDKRQKFINYVEKMDKDCLYVVAISKHYFILDTRDMSAIDNQTLEWSPVSEFKHKNKQIKRYFKINTTDIMFEPSLYGDVDV
jgi:hypothetical protein